MKVVKCAKCEKFYDVDSYSSCPHCGFDPASDNVEEPIQEKEKKGFAALFTFGGGKRKSETSGDKNTPPVSEDDAEEKPTASVNDEPEQVRSQSKPKSVSKTPVKNPTQDFWQASDSPLKEKYDQHEDQDNGEMVIADAPAVIKTQEDKQEPDSQGHASSLLDQIEKSSSTKKGVTLSYFSSMTGNVAEQKNVPKAEPVVGWLVCVQGIHMGKSFQLYTGNCSIGRDDTNKISIDGDLTISASKHAFIIYEPKKRCFYVKPGDSSGLVYVNGDSIFETTPLQAKDNIELGNSKFLFVPLCDENFSWEEYINKD